jgi:hypothetical protein
MVIKKAHGYDHYSSIHLFVVWKIVWVEDFNTIENTLEILVTRNKGNELKLLLLGHM